MRVVVVEDDRMIAAFIIKGLKEAGYTAEHAADGYLGYQLLCDENFDVAVVDIMLPKMDGLTLVETLRSQNVKTPVIFLSAKRNVDDRIRGLRAGGDDYMVKPFAFAELLARLQALIRRASGTADTMRLSVGELELDLLKHHILRDGRPIELQPREFSLLEFLMRNAGHVVSKTMIVENVWDYQFDPGTNVVEACVCRLRNKLNEGFDKKLVRTIRGVGYVLDKPA